jgi:hypothetical protein
MDELIELLENNRVRYLVIGGQAMRLQGMPRFSMDWDLFIPAKDAKNARLINELLADELDVPLALLGERGENFVQTYQTKWGVVQFHLGVPGLSDFDEVEKRAIILKTESGAPVKCVSGEDLLRSKKSADRAVDMEDVKFLEKKLGIRRDKNGGS